jgi:SsrA-binding protein
MPKPKAAGKTNGRKIVAENRTVSYKYHILERFEAGLVLTGTEVKALREARANIRDAYGLVRRGEAWLINCHISPYSHSGYVSHQPLRDRKLLLHREEIGKLRGRVEEKGLTLVPIRLYFRNGRAKVELALVKGKKVWDRRAEVRRRTADREIEQELKRYR